MLAVRLHVAHETIVPRVPHRHLQPILSASDSFGNAQSIGLLPHDATVRAVQPDARQVTHLTQVYENIPLRRIPFEEERVGVDGSPREILDFWIRMIGEESMWKCFMVL